MKLRYLAPLTAIAVIAAPSIVAAKTSNPKPAKVKHVKPHKTETNKAPRTK